jgi:hypothetical protein
VSVADLDGDGDLDALSASSYGNEIAWYENTAGDASSWTKHVLSTAATNAKTVLAADIDGDGALDVVAGSFGAARVAWYENLEGTPPTFTLHTIATDFSDRWALFAADIDGDGSMDVVSASYSESTISWHENDGSGGGWARHFIATGVPGAYSVHAADLDLDGDLDVAAASIGNDTVAWYENDGSGEGWAVSLLSTSADRANTVSAADLDGDGDLDALSASANDNKSPGTRTSAPTSTTTASTPTARPPPAGRPRCRRCRSAAVARRRGALQPGAAATRRRGSSGAGRRSSTSRCISASTGCRAIRRGPAKRMTSRTRSRISGR